MCVCMHVCTHMCIHIHTYQRGCGLVMIVGGAMVQLGCIFSLSTPVEAILPFHLVPHGEGGERKSVADREALSESRKMGQDYIPSLGRKRRMKFKGVCPT